MISNLIKACLLLLIFSSNTQAQSLKLASDTWAPFTDTEDKQSIAIDIVSEALQNIDVKNSNQIVTFKEVTEGIKNNTFDGSAALWKTKEREESMIFSAPYLENQLVLVANIGTKTNLSVNSDLHHKKLGLVKGYAYDQKLLSDPNIEFVYSKNDQENLEKLLSKEIDYFLVDNLLIQYMLKFQINDVEKYLSIASKPFITKTLHFAINKSVANADQIMQEFDKEIKSMMKNGSYNKIMQLDWIKIDINNDGVSELVFNGEASNSSIPNRSYAIFYDESQPEGFYINGVQYTDWESVPNEYKNNIPKQNNQGPVKIGMQIPI